MRDNFLESLNVLENEVYNSINKGLMTDVDLCAYMLKIAFDRGLSPMEATVILLNFFDPQTIDEAAKKNTRGFPKDLK